MPFDALRGLKEAIAAKERVIEPRRYPSEDAIAEINEKLLGLHKGQIVTVVYYGIYEQIYLQVARLHVANLPAAGRHLHAADLEPLAVPLAARCAHQRVADVDGHAVDVHGRQDVAFADFVL